MLSIWTGNQHSSVSQTPSVKSQPVEKLPPPASALMSRCIVCRLNLPSDGRIHITSKRSAAHYSNDSPTSLFSDGGHAGNRESCEQRAQGNKSSCFHNTSQSSNVDRL